jgi:hypothetical protein
MFAICAAFAIPTLCLADKEMSAETNNHCVCHANAPYKAVKTNDGDMVQCEQLREPQGHEGENVTYVECTDLAGTSGCSCRVRTVFVPWDVM